MGTHTNASGMPYHSHSDLAEPSVIMHRFGNNTIYSPSISQYFSNVSIIQLYLLKSFLILKTI